MTLKPWLIAAMTLVVVLGLGATIGRWYMPPWDTIQVIFKDNSCDIRCSALTPHPSAQGGVACPSKTAPLCQCTDVAKPIAACVPLP
jgi:hypothetical protein